MQPTADQVADLESAAKDGDVYAVCSDARTIGGRSAMRAKLRAMGLSPEATRVLGWATQREPGPEPPAPAPPPKPSKTPTYLEIAAVPDPPPEPDPEPEPESEKPKARHGRRRSSKPRN